MTAAPRKFCIFCGTSPEEKTKEHVLPTWLIELTGNPTRVASLGLDLSKGVDAAKPREYAFSQFHFPACKACNETFSILENNSKVVIQKLLGFIALSPAEISTLLDWLDKVRLGLWLGFHQLDKNFEDIKPRFHVSQRIGKKDRLVKICYSAQKQSHLSFSGPSFLTFRWLPSAFALIINNLFLVNVSFDYLLARRLGFPFPKQPAVSLGPGNPDYVEISPGLEKVTRPLVRTNMPLNGTAYFQPMFPDEQKSGAVHYESEYVRNRSLDWDAGIGRIYCVKGDRYGWIENDGIEPWWVPTQTLDRRDALKKSVLSVISMLQFLAPFGVAPFDRRPESERRLVQMRADIAIEELSQLRRMTLTWPDGKTKNFLDR